MVNDLLPVAKATALAVAVLAMITFLGDCVHTAT